MSETTTYRNALPNATLLLEYRLEGVLGAGGSGITYLAWDAHLEEHVAIKEYLPTDLAMRALDGSVVPVATEHEYDYHWGLERFIQEACTLARFNHPHIVRVNQYFEANGTGYMVMDYEKGESLNQMLRRAVAPDEAGLRAILMPLLDGLQAVHEAGFLHRDIKPTNIFLRETGGPVLLDFGAARAAVGGATRSMTVVLTPGYAPLEQYASEARQGPWSDLYALACVLYRAIVGENPPDAVTRLKDDFVPQRLADAPARMSAPFVKAVEWALVVDGKRRPQNVPEWRRALLDGRSAPAPVVATAATAPTILLDAASAPRAMDPKVQAAGTPQPTHRARPRRSWWRWAALAAVVLVLVTLASAWNKQRKAAHPSRLPTAVERQLLPGSKLVPGRPSRDRTERPGDEQEALRQ
ncbi:MAG: serine/threonine protein kinase [Betaproteobacteria bacterium]|nr:serine/threonine protein kinase [Betaproteobacteria bacterium]MDH3436843.1 serine/threonine protein kinase [Betaproteobacteria bacterium]